MDFFTFQSPLKTIIPLPIPILLSRINEDIYKLYEKSNNDNTYAH